jgi:hypothetical protein
MRIENEFYWSIRDGCLKKGESKRLGESNENQTPILRPTAIFCCRCSVILGLLFMATLMLSAAGFISLDINAH